MKYFLCCVLFSIQCSLVRADWRFIREELGYSDRLRFTSGQFGYYNCTIENETLVSNLKIGIYTHNTLESKVSLIFSINDTNSYSLAAKRVEDFYFVKIKVKRSINKGNKVLKLMAKNNITNELVDKVDIHVWSQEKSIFPPAFTSSSGKIDLDVSEAVFLGSVVGKIHLRNSGKHAIVYMDEKHIGILNEFSVSVDGRIFLTSHLNAAIKKTIEFRVKARFPDSDIFSSVSVRINIKPAPVNTKRLNQKLHNMLLKSKMTRKESISLTSVERKVYSFSVSELAPQGTIVGCLKIFLIPNVNYFKIGGDSDEFHVNKDTGMITIENENVLDYEKKISYNFDVAGIIANENTKIMEAKVTVSILDANDNRPQFEHESYDSVVQEGLPPHSDILLVKANDLDGGNNGRISYVLSNNKNIPFSIDADGLIKNTRAVSLTEMRAYHNLYVKAIDWGSPYRQESEVLVTIKVAPLNLHAPVMKQSSCDLQVSLNKETKSLVKLHAVDRDFNDKIVYKLRNARNVFNVDEQTGELTYSPASNVKENSFILKVYGFDGLHESTDVTLTVSLGTERDITKCEANKDYKTTVAVVSSLKSPEEERSLSNIQHQANIVFNNNLPSIVNVAENLPVNSFVAQFPACNNVVNCHNVLLYTIQLGNENGVFQIDMFNGTLYTINTLDRESSKQYQLVIRASDPLHNYKEFSVKVTVSDVNDHAPEFTENGTYTVYVHEDWQIARKLITVKATDADSDSTNIEYSLVNPSSLFFIDKEKGALSLLMHLSEYPYKEYFVQVQATDNSKIQDRQGFAVVRVIINESLNNPPKCLTHNQHIEVPIDSPPGVIVGRMFGYDGDAGRNGELSYMIKSTKQLNQFGDYQDTSMFTQYFSMDENSGLIQLLKPLPLTFERFKIDVELQDSGEPSLKATCLMHATITEGLGNLKPVFDHAESPLIVTVSEGIPYASQVVNVKASLPGRQVGTGIRYIIVDGSGIADFLIKNEDSGIISNVERFFTSKFYWLTVQAQVLSNPAIFTNSHILIKIKPMFVKRPYFYPSVHHINIYENKLIGGKVVQLNIMDPSEDDSDKNDFKIHAGNTKKLFAIDSKGLISVQNTLLVGYHSLNITVRSIQDPSLFSYGFVHVVVTKVDGPPKLYNSFSMSNIQIFESNGVLHPPYLFQILAENVLSDGTSLFLNTDDESIFSVNPNSGAATSNVTLEVGYEGFFSVVAKNSRKPELKSSEGFFGITVVPRPQQPTSLKFKQMTYVLSIVENSVGELINLEFEVEKTTRGPVFFYILSGNQEQKFYFPFKSVSKLIVLNPLDYERKQSHTLRILAFDGWSFAETEIVVKVKNINDNQPSTSQACYKASVKEGFRHSKESILEVKVIDPDNLNSVFMYNMINNFDIHFPFTVNKSNGAIMVHPVQLDREEKAEYIMTVIAQNAEEKTMFCVSVSVEDANDNKPKFTRESYSLNVVDTAPVHTTVMVVYATDKDAGSNGEVTYSLSATNNFFAIDPKYGFVYVRNKLTELSGKSFNLQLVATDKGESVLIGYANLKISISADPNNMWFKAANVSGSLSENMPPGTLLINNIRVDSTAVNYEIVKKDDECYSSFWIEPFTGTVLIKTKLDAENISTCYFGVNGITNQQPVTALNVYVDVRDENDNLPVLKQQSYTGNISESLRSSSYPTDSRGNALRVEAMDIDSGTNGLLKYKIVENVEKIYFLVDENTGEITTNMVLDYEKHPKQFDFHVKVSDQGFPGHSVLATITIHLNDINDRVPYFKTSYDLTIRLPVYNNMRLEYIQAFDDDSVPDLPLVYRLIDENEMFGVESYTGLVYIKNAKSLVSEALLSLEAVVSDGTFEGRTALKVRAIKFIPDETFRFLESIVEAKVAEDVSHFSVARVVEPVGYMGGLPPLKFSILNPVSGFDIMPNIGVIVTTENAEFDHEKNTFHLLHVEAKYGGLFARTMVNVSILDVNDHTPQFSKKRYYRAVDIDMKRGVELLRVNASDADSDENGKVRYKLLSDEGYFQCDPVTGVITLKKEFVKSLTKPKYEIGVRAYDNGTTVLSSVVSIEIPVLNEDQPMFTNSYEISIEEDVKKGESLLVAEAKGAHDRQVFYQVYSGDEEEMFEVGFTTGELKVAGHLDFEKKNLYVLKMKATDSLTGSWALTDCKINLIDVNDNTPLFKQPFYNALMKENSVLGSSVITIYAEDADSGSNGLLTYTIPDEQKPLFTIHPQSGVVTTTALLDAEIKSVHLLHITVSDQGKLSKSSFTTLEVVLQDVNDNPPVFHAKHYDFYVSKFLNEKQFIGKVTACDADANSTLEYSLSKTSTLIELDPSNGVISLNGSPEQLSTISLEVIATDKEFVTFVGVLIHFRARNDYRPIVLDRFEAVVMESMLKSVFILSITPVDRDQGVFGNISYQIDSEVARKYFRIDSKGDLYTTGAPLDRELIQSLDVPVRVTDQGGLFSLTHVKVTVQDQNDNIPTFEFPTYQTSIRTSQVYAQSLLQVSATDLDVGVNSELFYVSQGLWEGNNAPISVDGRKGLVSLSGIPKGSMYQFLVSVADNGYPVQKSHCKVFIFVKAWHEEILAFENKTYHLTVQEDVPVKTTLITLTATLKGYNGSYKYSLLDGNLPSTKASRLFKINSRSGRLRIKKSLDYELIKSHKLQVQVNVDNGDDVATCYVIVNVENINDNSPKFQSDKYQIKISEDTPSGTVLLWLLADDIDEKYNKNSTLSYEITSDNTDLFSVHQKTGRLMLQKELDRESEEQHEITVLVKDLDRKSDTTQVVITLIDVNDSPPVFLAKEYAISVKEDGLIDQTVLSLKASDADTKSSIQYFVLLSNSNNFEIGVNSGNLYLLGKLTLSSYKLTVLAYDGIHTGVVDVNISIEDLNNNYPICLSSYYTTIVEENTAMSELSVHVNAMDNDPSDSLQYSLRGDVDEKFTINSETGVISALSSLDFESESKYSFKVLVSDRGGHTCSSDVFVIVLDQNDNKPTFLQRAYNATVRANATVSSVVTQVKAYDMDSFKNRQITYQLRNNINNAFAINSQGIITVNNPKEISRRQKHNLEVVATDKGYPSKTTQATVNIIAIAESDVPPKFEKYAFMFRISENNKPGTVIGHIKVTPTDNFRTYKILKQIQNTDLFSIESNGDLKVLKQLDYEENDWYTFSVKASYEGIPLFTVVMVEVHVDDQNDNTPTFIHDPYFTQIDENIRSGTFVLQTFAIDKDGSKENAQITYSIDQNELIPFKIHYQTGVISVDGSIDHEKQDLYQFTVSAVDNGIKKRFSKANVTIAISDLNDNAPVIRNYNTTIIIQESILPGSEILKLQISDPDSGKNGAPFYCSLLSGNIDLFVIQTEENNCVVESKGMFSWKEKAEHQLVVRIMDSGMPKQYSDSTVKVMVVKESYHPPKIIEPKVFFVIVSEPYGITTIGKVNLFDKDENDIHTFSITGGTSLEYFSIQTMTGMIEGKPQRGVYSLVIEAKDAKNSDSTELKIIVNELNADLATKSVVLNINGIGVDAFLEYKIIQFVKVLARITGNSMEDVFVWSVQESRDVSTNRKKRNAEEKITIGVAVQSPENLHYVPPELLKNYIEGKISEFEGIELDLSVSPTECSPITLCAKSLTCAVTLVPINRAYLHNGYVGFKKEERCYCSDGTEGPMCFANNPCSRKPCKVGEKCVATSTSYHCNCVDAEKCGRTGDSVMLNGKSYMSYTLQNSFDKLFNTLSFHFRTEAEDGYLVYAQDPAKDSFIVKIKETYLQINFDFGSGVGYLRIGGVKVNDGNWHHVYIQRSNNYVSMTLDYNAYTVNGHAPGNSAQININGKPLVFGAGLTNDGLSPFSGFVGCIKEPKLNKELLPFSGATDLVSNVVTQNLEPGCKDSGLCVVKRCPKFSDCFNSLTSYRCVCLTGHHGASCISNLTCEDRPCKNNGLCTLEREANSITYKCTCEEGYTGGQCHISMGECASYPCLNGATCTSTSKGHICTCKSGFSGRRCEFNDNPCASNPCYNGGKCRGVNNMFKCDCRNGKTGLQCSAGEHCHFTSCENGGTCYEKEDGALCICKSGFTGPYCKQDENECLRTEQCRSKGVCVNTFGSFYCNCTNSALQDCTLSSHKSDKEELPLMFIIIGAAGFVILLVMVVIIVICCKRCNSGYVPASLEPEVRKYPLNRYGMDHYEMHDMFRPNPPPRGVPIPPGYYDDNDQASAVMYDPSMVTFSGASSPDEKLPLKGGSSKTSMEYNSEEDLKSLPGYHWDYSEVPEDVINIQMSREGSRLGLTSQDPYGGDYVDLPQLPERPTSRRSSLPGYSECDTDCPELPELPQHVRLSRQSLKSSNHSPYLRRAQQDVANSDEHRHSMLSDDEDGESYLHSILEDETVSDITNVTRPYKKLAAARAGGMMSEISDISEDYDGYTETSLNSDDDDDDAAESDPLDPEDTRKLERDIKRLFKDIQKRTEDD